MKRIPRHPTRANPGGGDALEITTWDEDNVIDFSNVAKKQTKEMEKGWRSTLAGYLPLPLWSGEPSPKSKRSLSSRSMTTNKSFVVSTADEMTDKTNRKTGEFKVFRFGERTSTDEEKVDLPDQPGMWEESVHAVTGIKQRVNRQLVAFEHEMPPPEY
jgi:hypothetical protein